MWAREQGGDWRVVGGHVSRLALLFGVGVLRESGPARPLRLVGVVLTAHAVMNLVIGTLFNDYFSGQQRGAGSPSADLPHILMMGAVVLFLIIAMAAGLFTLGRRFRIFSLAMLLTFLVFGALTGGYITRVAAGEATPGLGIVERIDVYASMVWLTGLSLALLRRPGVPRER